MKLIHVGISVVSQDSGNTTNTLFTGLFSHNEDLYKYIKKIKNSLINVQNNISLVNSNFTIIELNAPEEAKNINFNFNSNKLDSNNLADFMSRLIEKINIMLEEDNNEN